MGHNLQYKSRNRFGRGPGPLNDTNRGKSFIALTTKENGSISTKHRMRQRLAIGYYRKCKK